MKIEEFVPGLSVNSPERRNLHLSLPFLCSTFQKLCARRLESSKAALSAVMVCGRHNKACKVWGEELILENIRRNT